MMLILVTVVAALTVGFLLGRIWEIRKTLSRPPMTAARHSNVQADHAATPRNLLAPGSEPPSLNTSSNPDALTISSDTSSELSLEKRIAYGLMGLQRSSAAQRQKRASADLPA
jgi:hypothetical protein